MAARIELPFLYHTRTILRLPKRARLSCPRFVSTQGDSDAPIEDGKPPLSSEEESFLKAKARSVSRSPIAPRSASKNAETTISSTITASERRAFETILRFAPKQTEPASSKRRSPYADAADTDIENILEIFTSSIRSHQSARDNAQLAQKLDSDVADQEAGIEPPDVQTSTERAQTTRPVLRPTEQSILQPTQHHEPESIAQPGFNAAQERGGSSGAPVQAKAPSTVERIGTEATEVKDLSGPLIRRQHLISAIQEQRDILEQSLAETAIPSRPFGQLEESIQHAVRERMHSISQALQEAAHSKDERGDIAMWEVCESQIFSMARDLQPQSSQQSRHREQRPIYGGIRKFTFTREKSDDPRQLIEAAERLLRVSSPTPSTNHADDTSIEPKPSITQHTTTPSTLSTTQLAILQHTYPASLLLALRLYISLYPSSPHPLLLLPRIRSLGTTSYVLGASPQFYNSLMSLVWLTRSSLREVDGLLAEMERGGVEMDEGTYAVLGRIEEERAVDLAAERGRERQRQRDKAQESLGSRGAAWWRRQEQMLWFPRILDWLDVVAGRLAARERTL
ncbi:uncharacterized protein Z519_09645 [Cladophialophora bantiana CBS 173.52]|uniref:Mtf2-like C-terminal domain-containing protein n=1 Tax=Cladophialophora bantiana (strain ATCC 10958 / CBS 173.52 / CDC B-1940 / NIH 8579) TaxID=1442370 RepID=A0A0D2HY78_CLAB1|nr:uncharacterized protein Z519_09645 [Cladophialophora bantiana CBS 173.52]KIW89489.1 hypothetical protein Z519_09645 [Cladophialophora bantiana CBS 173.52]